MFHIWKQPKLNPTSKELVCLTYLIAVTNTSPVQNSKSHSDIYFLYNQQNWLHQPRLFLKLTRGKTLQLSKIRLHIWKPSKNMAKTWRQNNNRVYFPAMYSKLKAILMTSTTLCWDKMLMVTVLCFIIIYNVLKGCQLKFS